MNTKNQNPFFAALTLCAGLAAGFTTLSASGAAYIKFDGIDGEVLERARPLPVLLVIADQQDFYFKEYADTRLALEQAGLEVQVAATTTARSVPHPGTGEPAGTDGGVVPDLGLADVKPGAYSAIAFVGGWGSSMYQYAYNDPNGDGRTDNFYSHGPYNGDDDLGDGRIGLGKALANRLIGAFLAQDKPVAGVCHGTTVLAWARVDGVSPLRGRRVSVPFIGSPATFYRGRWFGNFELGQYEQAVVNGAIPNRFSGQYGDPSTAADDVVVDGRIITAENYDSAFQFGRVLASEVLAAGVQSKPTVALGTPVRNLKSRRARP
jgi:putative intracellular protease/amidase